MGILPPPRVETPSRRRNRCLGLQVSFAAIVILIASSLVLSLVKHRFLSVRLYSAAPPVPVYYINLDRSVDRRVYMEAMFQKYLDETNFRVTRIPAVDLKNEDDIADLLGIPHDSVTEQIRKFCDPYSLIALTLTHFKAMAKAQEDNVDFAIVMEDDASFDLVPFWPKPLHQLVQEVQEKDPEWDAIRLQYTAGAYGQFSSWRLFQDWKFTYPELPSVVRWRYKSDDEIKKHAVAMQELTWSSVAILWSRKAIDRFVSSFVNVDGRSVPEYAQHDPLSRHTFNFSKADVPEPSDCSYDSLLHTIPLREYYATPPYFCVRAAEGSTGVRTGDDHTINDHVETHLASRAFAIQFMLDSLELQHSKPQMLPVYQLTAGKPSDSEAQYANKLIDSFMARDGDSQVDSPR